MNVPQKTILIAEDNSDWVSMMADFLRTKGYCVITASDGVEAVEMARSGNPQLILMDIDMPRLSGLEATKQIRAMEPFRHTPIVALSALANTTDRDACMRAGATQYLAKPCSLNILAEIVARELKL